MSDTKPFVEGSDTEFSADEYGVQSFHLFYPTRNDRIPVFIKRYPSNPVFGQFYIEQLDHSIELVDENIDDLIRALEQLKEIIGKERSERSS